MPPQIRLLKEADTDEFGPTSAFRKIGPYSTLRTLRIGQNRLSKLPLNFAQLFVNLKTLVANKNDISSLPVDLFDLPMLQVLVLSRNGLSTLPPVSNPDIRLRCLVLGKNQFQEVPISIGKMKLLQKLYFDNNKIVELPKFLGVLKYMYKLDLSNNQLTGDTVLASGLCCPLPSRCILKNCTPRIESFVWCQRQHGAMMYCDRFAHSQPSDHARYCRGRPSAVSNLARPGTQTRQHGSPKGLIVERELCQLAFGVAAAASRHCRKPHVSCDHCLRGGGQRLRGPVTATGLQG